MCVAKTKALISFAVTAKLISAFVFAYADCCFPIRRLKYYMVFGILSKYLVPWVIMSMKLQNEGKFHFTKMCMYEMTLCAFSNSFQ